VMFCVWLGFVVSPCFWFVVCVFRVLFVCLKDQPSELLGVPGIQVKYTCDSTIQPFDCYAVICVEEKGAPRVGYRLAVSRVWVAIELRLRDLGEDLLQQKYPF